MAFLLFMVELQEGLLCCFGAVLKNFYYELSYYYDFSEDF